MRNYPPLQVIIHDKWDGRSVHSILQSEFMFSRSRIRGLKKGEYVKRNGTPIPLWERVYSGDNLTIEIPLIHQDITGDDLPLKIIYEDDDLIVINKQVGMVVHPSKGHPRFTLANALRYYWDCHGAAAGFHPVHRLDRWTSGLIVVAKSPWAHQQLDRALQKQLLVREYLAISEGELQNDSGVISAPIMLTEDTYHRGVGLNGQSAVTRFRVVERYADATLIFCRLSTGRTHQIRVHMSHIGHPLVGDEFYGGDNRMDRPALHACRIRLPHPRNGQILRLNSPLPDDMKSYLAKQSIKSRHS